MRFAIGLSVIFLLIITTSLFFVRQEPSTARWIVFKGDDYLYRMTEQGTIIRQISVAEVDDFALSPFGDSIAYIQRANGQFTVQNTDLLGTDDRFLAEEIRPRSPVWSPDGKRVAYVSYDEGRPQLISVDIQTLERKRIVDEPVSLGQPVWTRQQMAAYSNSSGGTELLIIDTLTEEVHNIANVQGSPVVTPTFSPDGEWVLFPATYAEARNSLNRSAFGPDPNSLHVIHHDGRALRLITVGITIADPALWVDDWIIFSGREANGQRAHKSIYRVKPDGSQLAQLTRDELNANVTDISADAKWLLIEARPFPRPNREVRLFLVSIDGAVAEEILTPFHQVQNAKWTAIVDLHMNSVILFLAGVLSGVLYVAFCLHIQLRSDSCIR